MRPFTPLLISSFFFSGFAIAGVYTSDCSSANTGYPPIYTSSSQSPVPSSTSSTPPNTGYPPVYTSSHSQSYVPTTGYGSSTSGSAYSNTTPPVTVPVYYHGGHSHKGPIAGGVIGGIAGICIVFAGMWFFRKRRRPTPYAGGESGAYNNPTPYAGQEPVTSSVPGTATSLVRPYNQEGPTNPSHTPAQA